MAEAHPVGFQWVMEAKSRGARVIHIDPRFTRTSAVADTYVPIRAGTDIAFLGGVINYILSNDLDFREYVAAYTNAAILISRRVPRHRGSRRAVQRLRRRHRDLRPQQLAVPGRRPGRSPTRATRPSSRSRPARCRPARRARRWRRHRRRRARPDAAGPALRLPDPQAALRALHPGDGRAGLRHAARAVPGGLRGVDGELGPRAHGGAGLQRRLDAAQRRRPVHPLRRDHPAAAGQHRPAGRRRVRAARARQHPGLHGHPDAVQPAARLPADAQRGATTTSRATSTPCAAARRRATGRRPTPTWCRCSRSTSASTPRPENDFGFDLLPRISGDHGTYRQVMDMVDGGKVFGYFLLGQNPAVGSAHGKLQRLGMANLDWVVVRDLAMIESATFWKDSPEIETGEIVPEECRTEVFFFPAASHVEKEGTFTQTQRMVQWREKAVDPTGDQRSDLWFFYHLGRMVKERLAASTDPRDEPCRSSTGATASRAPDDVGRAVGRGRPAADQRLRRRHRQARRRLPRAQGRRLHGVRLLDLLRRVRGRGEPGRAPQAALGAGPVRRGVGLDVAGEPAGALQPLLGRPRGQALERAQEARLVGRGQGRVDRARRAGLPADHRARARPRAGVDRRRGPARRRRVHHAGRRQGVAVRAERRAGRAAAHALRGLRVAGAQPALRPAGQPDRQGLRAGRTTRRTRTRGNPGAPTPSRSCSPRPGSPSTTRRAG